MLQNSLLLLLLLLSQNNYSQEKDVDNYRNKGYFNVTRISFININSINQELFIPGEGNFSYDLDSSDSRAYSLQTINGYFFSPYFSAGIGVGLDGYHNPTLNTFPVFLDLRGYLNNNYNTPFIFLDWGTLLELSESFNKGNMFNIGIGYRVFVSKNKRVAITPEFGYSLKSISLTGERVKTSDNVLNLRGLHFSIGVTF